MAYVIGSQKGKDIAINMMPGETYKASDGSTWTKKNDGSVSVTHNGKTYDNAYVKPTTTSGGTSNKTNGSSGGSSGSGTSNKSNSSYSPYTNLGSTWDANTDYQAIINNAVANGDYVTAAKAEQLRNQKITSMGLSQYGTTNKYGGHIDGIDYGTVGINQMASGANWEDVLATYNSRFQKAATTEGLGQYAQDDIQQQMWQYILQNMQQSNQPEAFSYDEAQPTAPDQDPRINKLLSQILNRDDFSYDVASDPLYQQYKEMYNREGDRAMRDTLAEAAAGAGGMNSYAMTAAMQANNYYNSQLNDRVPELYQLAYQMYLNDKESMVQDLGILQDMDATQYSRYRDTMNDWYADRNFAYGQYQDAVNQGNWQTNFDYNAMVNNRDFMYNDIWANKEWNTNQADKELANSRYDKEKAQEEVWNYVSLGVTPSADLIARAGMDSTEVALAVEAVKAEQAKSGGSSGGSKSTGGIKLGYDPEDDGTEKKSGETNNGWYGAGDILGSASSDALSYNYEITNDRNDNRIIVSGIGPMSYVELENAVNNGTVEEIIDHKNKTISYRKKS